MDGGVRIVPVGSKEAAEGVFHGSGGGGIDVALNRRQMNDVLANKVIRYLDTSGKTLSSVSILALGV